MVAAGDRLTDRYELLERLGSGGSAEVWRAHDHLLDRPVALKILSAEAARDPGVVERFRREARAAAALNHPNIVAIYDTGDIDDLHYIVMELVDGPTLRTVLGDLGPLEPERAVAITAQVGEALVAAHIEGIVHRDIKPANVMFASDWTVKVADFGIARILSAATQAGQESVFGSIPYIAPEQARGESVDARADLYGLGCVLYEMLTGRPPFTGDAPVAVLHQHLHIDPSPPSEVVAGIDSDLDAIVLHALAKDPDQRYGTAEQLLDDLDRITAGQAPQLATVAALATDETRAIPRVEDAAAFGAVLDQELGATSRLARQGPPTSDHTEALGAVEVVDDRRGGGWRVAAAVAGLVLGSVLLAALVVWAFFGGGGVEIDDDGSRPAPVASDEPSPTPDTATDAPSPTPDTVTEEPETQTTRAD